MATGWTVSRRFYAAFAVIGAGLATSAALVGLLSSNAESSLRTAKHGTEGAVTLAAAQSALWELRYGFPQYMVSDAAGRAKVVADEPKLRSRIEDAFKKYETSPLTEAEKKSLASLREVFGKYMDARPKWFELYGADKLDEAKAWRAATTTPLGAGTVKGFSELIDLQKQVVESKHQQATDSLATSTQRNWIVLLATIVLSAIAGWLLRQSIVRQLGGEPEQAVDAVNRIADGDLTTAVRVAVGDQTSVMASMQRMQTSLAELVRGIAVGSEQIRTASQEVARGNLDLSSRTEQQASSLQETASSMEQITGNVRQAADNAHQANKLAQMASQSAERGGNKIGSVESTMQDIAASSAKVENIIGVIDGIAFQTNILALNAAVEAARAGEQGRGFAVVAAEVRSLAQRSAEAAREIKQLIQQSTAKVGDGSRQVAEASEAMREILGAIRNASTMMGEITAGTAEQLSGIEQVNQAVAQLDAVTQQNAALVEEATAATQSMEQQSMRLSTAIRAFKVEGGSIRASGTALPVLSVASKPAASTARPATPATAAKSKPRAAVQPMTTASAVASAPAPTAVAALSASDEWNEF